MPALNFNRQFVEKIHDGYKTTTIRAPRKDGKIYKKGDKLMLYTGMRTKHCRKIAEAIITDVCRIKIGSHYIIFNNHHISGDNLEPFAIDDGFESFDDMREFFSKTHGIPFTGTMYYFKIM